MLKKLLIMVILLSCVFLTSACGKKESKPENLSVAQPIINNTMQITSSQFKNNEYLPAQYGCKGTNINPPLTISDVPAGAKSLALIVDDPDAPRGDWVHWVVFNIPPETREIAEGSVPAGATQGTNDFGNANYGEPCPPFDTHRYFFKVYALDTTLNLGAQTTKQDLEKAVAGHILDKAELVGLFARK